MTTNGVQIRKIINITYCNKQQSGSDFDVDKARLDGLGMMLDIIGSFSPRIIKALERRMNACMSLLLSHIDDIEYCDEMGHICWRRKDGTPGNFNVHSFEAMDECIGVLKRSEFKKFTQNKLWIDQVLKALLNDTTQDHSDSGAFKYSQLVSILCELQACPQEYLPK